jgi:hypothetical protein
MRVLVAVLVTVLAAMAPSTGAQPQNTEWRSLLGPEKLTPDIALSKVEEAKGTIVVRLNGQETCAFRNQLPKRLSDMTIQAWLLQADGTALAQSGKPSHAGWGNGGCLENPLQFSFEATTVDPVGIVLSIDGTLVAREIKARSRM